MSKNSGEYKSKVGLDQVYFAVITQDDASAYVAETPEYLAPSVTLSQEPASNSATQYADDKPFDVSQAEGETKLTLEVTALPLEVQAKLTGKTWDATTGRMYDDGGTPPFVALGFRSKKSNGKYRYFWFLRGTFASPKEESASQTDTPEPKTTTLEFTGVYSLHAFTVGAATKCSKRVVGDEDSDAFSATGWFTQVQVPGAVAPAALALSSSVPVDDATNVSKTANLTLTFNNSLQADAINSITLLDDVSAVVATTITLDATKKIATIAHGALAGSKAHSLVYAVTDIYGQTLTGVVTFTTIA